MNLLLFNSDELSKPLIRGDFRFDHIRKILKSRAGDFLDAGVINGRSGKIRIDTLTEKAMEFTFYPSEKAPVSLAPLTMIIGCPRPPTARRMVKDLTSMGVARLIFIDTELNEKSYLRAKLWRDGLYETALIEGAMQGKSTLIPVVDRFYSLKGALDSLDGSETRLVPDLTGGISLLDSLSEIDNSRGAVLAVGPERGWSKGEREIMARAGFAPVTLGNRVMRTETAAALAAGAVLLKLVQI
jgi:16S rRNA (uracil1498-N3)-methyltransferase